MIEFSKLSKTYSPKRGVPVKALKNVSFCLPDRGLIFILGRSGSGKSTALHLLGGLDTCTEGEIIIDGKSTKNFSQKEWDAYRNTEVGFVFQDYNLFERFNVAKNISLALELQGKTEREAVLHALEKVGLAGYEKRSPKELSGGQRQRVAIARAIVKDPSILLADEPTGALDTETGEEIFSLLKELSSEKLIVVVSHDREFAEKYADGILEFADGELIKNTVPANRSETQQRQPKKRGLRFLSRLQLSAMGLLQRPVRMALTILLSMICFALAAFTDSFATYDKKDVIYRSMQEADVTYLGYTPRGYWSQEDDAAFLNLTGAKERFFTTGNEIKECAQLELPHIHQGSAVGYETVPAFQSGLMEINEDTFSRLGLKLIAGELPHGSSKVSIYTVEEIAIPEFLYQIAQHYGFQDLEIEGGSFGPSGEYVMLETPQDILGKTLYFRGQTWKENYFFKIVGVVDTGFDFERYRDFFTKEKWMVEDALLSEFLATVCNQLHNVGFVREGWTKDIPHHGMDGEYIVYDAIEAVYDGVASDSLQAKTLYFHRADVPLGDREILLPLSQLPAVSGTAKAKYEAELRKLIVAFVEELNPGRGEELADMAEHIYPETYREKIPQMRKEAYLSLTKESSLPNDIGEIYVLGKEVSVVGCYDNLDTMDDFGGFDITVIANENALHEAMKVEDFVNHNMIFVPFRGEKAADMKLLLDGKSTTLNRATGIEYRRNGMSVFYNNAQIQSVVRSDKVLSELSQFFVWIALGVAIFACITFFGYIHASIIGRKREIGIFRSLGASKKDVFLLFFGESILISVISIVFALLLFGGAVIGFNLFFQTNFHMPITLLSVGIRQIAIVVGLSLLVAVTATLIPCYRNSCKKPIDVIRDLN